MDSLSLIEVLSDTNLVFEDVMKQKEWTRKGNLKNPHVAKVVASYALPMSTLFGKPRNGVFHPALPLPGIKNYEA